VQLIDLETIRFREHPNLLLVVLHTDAGLDGIGETYFGAAAVEAYLHESVAPVVLGRDPARIGELTARLRPYVGAAGSGAEVRGNSAIDIALWDLLGKRSGQPLYALWGGAVRDDVPVYNTCAGPGYVQAEPRQSVANWGMATAGRYEDLAAFLNRPAELARELLDEGVSAMKVWPFDTAAEASGGHGIPAADLARGLDVVEQIRAGTDGRMQVAVELHALWDVPTARLLLRSLEPLGVMWAEDPIPPDDVRGLAELSGSTSVPIATGETLAGARAFERILTDTQVAYPIVDVSWVGGLSEARKVAALADVAARPVLFHDCTGPVALAVSTQLAVHLPNVTVQETCRAFYRTWYADVAANLPELRDGRIRPATGAGHGVELPPGLAERPGVLSRHSSLPASARTASAPPVGLPA
jgi:L-alanine-DL-glutamate epimerase-like enolase superfamily enzyme